MFFEVFGDAAVSRKTAYMWFEGFRDGAEKTEDEQRSGRPSTSTTDKKVSKITK
jgi:transposase